MCEFILPMLFCISYKNSETLKKQVRTLYPDLFLMLVKS